MTTAQIIRQQIRTMTLIEVGAKDILTSESRLSFRLRGKSKGIIIEYRPGSDDYKVELVSTSARSANPHLREATGIYCDQLDDIILDFAGVK